MYTVNSKYHYGSSHIYVYVVLLVSVGIGKKLSIIFETIVANSVAWIKGLVCKTLSLLPLQGLYLCYYCVCLLLQIIPPRLLHIIFITELDLINACKFFFCVLLKPAIKSTPRKSKGS